MIDKIDKVNMILLGDVFIRNFYSVFDIESQNIKLGVKTNRENIAKINDLSISDGSEEM